MAMSTTDRYPARSQDFVVGGYRYEARVQAYVGLPHRHIPAVRAVVMIGN